MKKFLLFFLAYPFCPLQGMAQPPLQSTHHHCFINDLTALNSDEAGEILARRIKYIYEGLIPDDSSGNFHDNFISCPEQKPSCFAFSKYKNLSPGAVDIISEVIHCVTILSDQETGLADFVDQTEALRLISAQLQNPGESRFCALIASVAKHAGRLHDPLMSKAIPSCTKKSGGAAASQLFMATIMYGLETLLKCSCFNLLQNNNRESL